MNGEKIYKHIKEVLGEPVKADELDFKPAPVRLPGEIENRHWFRTKEGMEYLMAYAMMRAEMEEEQL